MIIKKLTAIKVKPKLKQKKLSIIMNILQQQIIEEIESLDSVPVECDGFARLTATILHRNNQDYSAFFGEVRCEDGSNFQGHFWIEWNNKIIDFRARMWLGESAQHGVLPKSEVEHLYVGELIDIPPLSPIMESILKTPFPDNFEERLTSTGEDLMSVDIVTSPSQKPKI